VGFSVSGSAAIIFIGVIVAAGVAIPSLVGSFGSLAGAQGEQVDRGVEALNTEFEIGSAVYDSGNTTLELQLNNTGSTTLSVNGTSVLVDGVIPSAGTVTTEVDGDTDTDLWLPGGTLTVTIEDVETEPARVKIVTENGIAETTTEFGG
jgi:flagellar protein FlaF